MADRIRAFDWSRTPVGALQNWPMSLRLAVGTLLECPTPMSIAWGEHLTLFYNDGYRMFLGSSKNARALGRPAEEVWREVWAEVAPMWRDVLQGRCVMFKDAMYNIERDGIQKPAYFDFSCSPVRDESGRVRGVLSIATETTARVHNEQRLRREEEKLRMLFMQAPAAVAILRGRDMRFELASIHYQRLVGKTEAQIVGKTVTHVFPELPADVKAVLRGVLDTGERFIASEWGIALDWRGDGNVHERFLNVVYEPLRGGDNSVDGLMVFAFDVSDQVLARRLAEDAKARTRFAVDAAGMGEWDLDLRTGAATRTARHDQCFGHDIMLPSWTYEDFLASVLPGHRQRIDLLFRDSVNGGSEWQFECPVTWPDGSVHWIASRARADRGADGKAFRLSGLVWDISESRAAHEALHEANRKKDEFLATLAHELRNPLAPIRNAAYVLGQPDISAANLAWCADVITRQSSHMALLLDDLLDVSRVSSGRMELKKEVVPLQNVVRSAVETVSALMERKKHALRINLPAEPIEVEVDPLRLAQVLSNLLTNAAKYTDPGGRIELNAVCGQEGLTISLRDNGIGVSRDALTKLFQMFSQVSSAVDRSEGGLGIGLALSKGLTELHGGTLRAHSEGLGLGTTMELHLPKEAVRTFAVEYEPAPVAESALNTARVVLVVDDNRDAADSLAMLIELEGHEVLVAYGPMEALAVGERKRPDMAILDIGMPVMNGYELARRIRAQEWGATTLLVAATGWGQEEDQRKAADAGFDRHLTKPIDPADVMTLLTKISEPSPKAPPVEPAS